MLNTELKKAGGRMIVASAVLNPPENGADASERIQSAIDECAKNGGGTVWLEAGEYGLASPLTVKTSVILSGCADPTKKNGEAQTVLLCRAGRNDPDGAPQITLNACSGVMNCVLVYPDNRIGDPVPYSPAIRQNGVDSANAENVVLVNPWRGIQCGPDGNELHFLKNVEMTPLDVGVYIDMTTDIGRMQGVRVTPDCYADYFGVPADEVRAYTLAHTTGVFMARSDWEYGCGIACEYCRTGVKITRVKDSGPNAQLSQVKLYNCVTGFEILDVNPYGIALSDSVITADLPAEKLNAAIDCADSFETLVQCCGVDFAGYGCFVKKKGKGQLSFDDCSFGGVTKDIPAIQADGGGISFLRCAFTGEETAFALGEIGGAQILGCTFGGGTRIDAEKPETVQFTEKAPDFPKMSRGGHKPYPYALQPENEALFCVLDFGAVRGGETDCAPAIRAALAAAKEAGGGIVYLPGGWYRCDSPLTIPSGVELRGVADVPMHTMGGGSVILSDWGKGDENAEPLTVMEENSGIRGVLYCNPGQNPDDPVPYPFAVQTRGKYCRIVNTVFINCWQSLDLWSYPSEGHYVSYISGAPIRCGVRVGSNDGEGWVENIQFNPHYWFRSRLPNSPSNHSWHTFWHHQMRNLEALKFGYNRDEHLLGTFVFAARHGLDFVKQDGRGTSGTFIGHGTDSGQVALYLGGAEKVELINTQLVNIEAEGRRAYLYSEPDEKTGGTGEYAVYNTLMWGDPHYAAIFDGGRVFVDALNIVAPGRVAVTVNGGEITLSNVFFARTPVLCEANGGRADFYAPVTNAKGEKPFRFAENGGALTVEYPMAK